MTTTSVQFSNFASTTLVGTYGTGDTALTVSNVAVFPSISVGTSWFYAVITDSLTAPTKREIVKVTNVSGSILTVTRAQDGTSAQSWATGSYIELRLVNKALQDLFDEAVSDASVADDELTSTGNITITFDSDNNGAGALNVLSGADTVLQVTNAGELIASPGYANIKDFGGDHTGVSDCVAAFNAAIAAGYTEIYFPAGTYLFASGVSTTGQNLKLFGAGAQSTILKCSSGGAGFTFLTFTGTYDQFTTDQLIVENLSIQTACASASAQGTAIKAVMNASSSTLKEPFSSVIIDKVEIGNLVDNACFAIGIELDSCQMAKINNTFVSGFMTTGASTGTRSGIGIKIYSRYNGSPSNNSVKGTDINITDCVLFQCTTCVDINNYSDSNYNFCEGVHIDGCTLLNSNVGIRVNQEATSPTDGAPGWYINGNHITCTDYAVDLQTVAQFFVTSNLIYMVGGTTTCSAIKVVSAPNAGYETDGVIADNTILNVGGVYNAISNPNGYSGNTYGIALEGADATPGTLSMRISNNSFQAFTNAAICDANTTGVVLTPDNRVISGSGYSDAGSGNIIEGFNTDIRMPNGKIIYWRDTGGTYRVVLQMYSDDGVYLKNLKAGENLFFVVSDTGSFVFREETGGATDLFSIYGDGRIWGSGLHDNANGVAGSTNQYIASGTYTPTLTNTTNISASTAYLCQWLRVGNVLTVSGQVDIDATSTGACLLKMTLPSLVINSNFTSVRDAAGTATLNNSGVANECGAIVAENGAQRVNLEWNATSLTNNNWTFTFTCLIR